MSNFTDLYQQMLVIVDRGDPKNTLKSRETLLELMSLVFASNYDSDLRDEIEDFISSFAEEEVLDEYVIKVVMRGRSSSMHLKSKLEEMGCKDVVFLNQFDMFTLKCSEKVRDKIVRIEEVTRIKKSEQVTIASIGSL